MLVYWKAKKQLISSPYEHNIQIDGFVNSTSKLCARGCHLETFRLWNTLSKVSERLLLEHEDVVHSSARWRSFNPCSLCGYIFMFYVVLSRHSRCRMRNKTPSDLACTDVHLNSEDGIKCSSMVSLTESNCSACKHPRFNWLELYISHMG